MPADTIIRAVRKRAPDARLRSNGFMFWIESGDEILGRQSITTDKAWRSALNFLWASEPAGGGE